MIEDLGSANGTFVAGRRLAANAPQAVGTGDVLRLADVEWGRAQLAFRAGQPACSGGVGQGHRFIGRVHEQIAIVNRKSGDDVIELG